MRAKAHVAWIAFMLWTMVGLLALPAQADAADGRFDAADLERFFDQAVAAQLQAMDIPGAAVAVVADDQVLLARGYGVADRESGQLVDGERTLFRTGSVAKLFTWTAVMQFVEQGLLDLHADINDYLDFNVPAAFAEPVTLADLMTHTAGFEDVNEPLFSLSEADLMPLREYVTRYQPARVYAPGTVQAYSNYGTALAGYIVERIAGQPFADYVETHILAPLGMSRTTLRQPVPAHLASDMATGYGAGEHSHLRGNFVFAVPYPAGSASAPAADMARFMLAHLNTGQHDGAAILQPAAAEAMQRLQWSPEPRLDGMGYGFMRQQVNGHDILFHRGSTFQFNAGLYLLPAENAGLYVVYNGVGGQDAPAQLWQAFVDRYYPAPALAVLAPADDAAARLAAYTGEYHLARADFSGAGMFLRLLVSAQVSASPDGYLQVMVEGQTERYVEVDPGLFRHHERDEHLAFHSDATGTQWLSLDGRPAFVSFTATSAFRPPWRESFTLAALLIGLTLLLFIVSSLAWLIGALRRRAEKQPRALRLARWLAVAFLALLLLFLVGLVSVVGDVDPAFGVPRIVFGAPPLADVVLLLPGLMAGLAVAMAVSTVLVWRESLRQGRRFAALGSGLHLSVLAGLALALVWWLASWNLLA